MNEETVNNIQIDMDEALPPEESFSKKRKTKKSKVQQQENSHVGETDASLSTDDVIQKEEADPAPSEEKPKRKRRTNKKKPQSEQNITGGDDNQAPGEQISLFDTEELQLAEPEQENQIARTEEPVDNQTANDVEDHPIGLEISHIEYAEPQEAEESEDFEEAERIIPPDEIFSSFAVDSSLTVTPLQEIIPVEDITENPTDDDGQYSITDLLPESAEVTKEEKKEEENSKNKLPAYDPDKPRKIDARFDFVELVIFTLLIVMLATSFLFRHSIVDGESMENTLIDGQHLIISDLFYTPQRGDIIVCEDYTTGLKKPIVKRVIAVAGDAVKITVFGEVYVNGTLLDESEYIKIDNPKFHYDPLEITVGEGELFVMGDHRNMSSDSRDFGTVSVESVLGKVLLRFYPFEDFGVPK